MFRVEVRSRPRQPRGRLSYVHPLTLDHAGESCSSKRSKAPTQTKLFTFDRCASPGARADRSSRAQRGAWPVVCHSGSYDTRRSRWHGGAMTPGATGDAVTAAPPSPAAVSRTSYGANSQCVVPRTKSPAVSQYKEGSTLNFLQAEKILDIHSQILYCSRSSVEWSFSHPFVLNFRE